MNNTTFRPTFPPPFGTWYSRYASIYVDHVQTQTIPAEVAALPELPRLGNAA